MYLPTATRPSLEGEHFHVIVIGGGVNGAAIARECARAGKRTLLAEQHDFASGATSRDTRLIHGAFKRAEISRDLLREQTSLLASRPHLVRPQERLVAAVGSKQQMSLKQRTGWWLYKQMGEVRSLAPYGSSDREKLELLLGNRDRCSLSSYEDAQCEFPERLVAEWLVEAAEAGAVVRNYTQALAIDVRQGRARGVLMRDRLSGSEAHIEANWIVNATGAEAERLCQRSRIKPSLMARTMRRSHLVLPRFAGAPEAAAQIEHENGTVLFLVPWHDQILVGGSAVPDRGDPAKVEPPKEDIQELLGAVQALLPSLQVSRENIKHAFSGLFLDVAGSARPAAAGSYLLHDHADEGAANMTTVLGGTLSSASLIGRECAAKFGCGQRKAPAEDDTLKSEGFNSLFDNWVTQLSSTARISEEAASAIAEWHGKRSQAVAELAARDSKMRATLCPHTSHIVAEVVDAFSNEFAVTLGDALLRRVPVALGRCWSAACSREAVTRIRAVAGWSEQLAASELEGLEIERAMFMKSPARGGAILAAAAD
jgi:glycerol-3-phosphate dehydrogenase